MVTDTAERNPWDRRDGETPKAYRAFRMYRDAGPLRAMDRLEGLNRRSVHEWSARWDWVARATAWDDAQHMAEDQERLESIRRMHRTHQVAARTAMTLALRALRELQPEDMTTGEVVRLLDLSTRLERLTLTRSVEELQGLADTTGDDPWDRIARELSGT